MNNSHIKNYNCYFRKPKNALRTSPDTAALCIIAGGGAMSALSGWGWLRLHLALACLLPSCPLLLLTYTTFSHTWEGGGLPPYRVLVRRYGGSGLAVLQNTTTSSMTLVLFRENEQHSVCSVIVER